MAGTAKSAKAATDLGYDLSTGMGFMLAFDREFERLNARKGWCSEAKRYAYSESGIPRPENRTNSPLDAVMAAADMFELSAKGKALVAAHAAEANAKLDEYRLGVRKAVIYGLQNRQAITLAEGNEILRNLGCPELVAAKRHDASYGGSVYFTTSRALTTDERESVRAAVQAATDAAITATVPADADVQMNVTNGPGNFYVESAQRSTSTYTA